MFAYHGKRAFLAKFIMKIRIRGNTIRLRLSQTDIQQLNQDGIIKETTSFNLDHHFHYALQIAENNEKITADFQNNEIRIIAPLATANEWIQTDLVGISEEIPIGNNAFLSILIEKDFQCLTERAGENEEDNFPNPNISC